MTRCPRCPAVALTEHQVDGVALDLCDSCGGVWLDEAEWLAVMGAPRHVAAPASVSLDARPNCPACTTALRPFGLGQAQQIEIDVCPECGGTWLDAYELARVQVAIATWRETHPIQATELPPARNPVRAAFTRDPRQAMTYLEAVVDTWRSLWRG